MSFDQQLIVGTWNAELSSDLAAGCVFRILDDLRYISFAEDDRPEARHRWIPITLWGSIENDGVYRLRPKKEHQGWTRRISFDRDLLIIEATEPEHRMWTCSRFEQHDIPAWFESEAAKVLSRPWR